VTRHPERHRAAGTPLARLAQLPDALSSARLRPGRELDLFGLDGDPDRTKLVLHRGARTAHRELSAHRDPVPIAPRANTRSTSRDAEIQPITATRPVRHYHTRRRRYPRRPPQTRLPHGQEGRRSASDGTRRHLPAVARPLDQGTIDRVLLQVQSRQRGTCPAKRLTNGTNADVRASGTGPLAEGPTHTARNVRTPWNPCPRVCLAWQPARGRKTPRATAPRPESVAPDQRRLGAPVPQGTKTKG
jgi:hypothetical protein